MTHRCQQRLQSVVLESEESLSKISWPALVPLHSCNLNSLLVSRTILRSCSIVCLVSRSIVHSFLYSSLFARSFNRLSIGTAGVSVTFAGLCSAFVQFPSFHNPAEHPRDGSRAWSGCLLCVSIVFFFDARIPAKVTCSEKEVTGSNSVSTSLSHHVGSSRVTQDLLFSYKCWYAFTGLRLERGRVEKWTRPRPSIRCHRTRSHWFL